MSAFSIGGIWTYPSINFPSHAEYMAIDESRGRIITFVVISIEPVKLAPIRSWYRPVSASSVAARLQATEPWRIHEFQLDGNRLLWKYTGGNLALRRIHSDEKPDWLETRLTTENSKMDAID